MSQTTMTKLDKSYVPAVWSRYTDLVIDRGEGSWLITTSGERYLDYSAGIGVTSTGHAHPRVVKAVQEQAARLLHGQQNIIYHEAGLRLHERLANLMPGEWRAFLSNSGAEAIEAAVKLARAATRRPAIVVFRGGFHGRTAQAMALTTSRSTLRSEFEPLPGSIYQTTYPYCYRSPVGSHSPENCTCPWEADLEMLFEQVIAANRVAAVLVEPIVGEGGYLVPPADFLPRLRAITQKYGILLIADEIQTGFGRTGKLFAIQNWDVQPDIITMAKGIASGLPLSGILARKDLFDAWKPGMHGGTYGGNVVACAAANATLDVIEDEGLIANAAARGRQLLDGLRAVARKHAELGDVRGLGLMVGLEFVKPGPAHEPDGALAHRVLDGALNRRLIALSAGTFGQVVRLIPPLVTTADEADLAIRILDETITEAIAAG
jgi:4-aminobutyrate aminotransferase